MKRVLIADDSATSRVLLREILTRDPALFVIAEARDGVEAVALNARLRPDLITMDLRMPRMNGFAATKEIMIEAPVPIVILSSAAIADDGEAEIAIHALRAGAVAILPKPPVPGTSSFGEQAARFNATIKAMAEVRVARQPPALEPQGSLPPPEAPRESSGISIVAVATSTGGPAALQCLLSGLPSTFSVPIVVVQHITSGFTAQFASWLNTVCGLRVKVAADLETLEPQTVYLAPEDRHLGVDPVGRARLSDAPPIAGFRPSGSFLFESIARAYGPRAAAVILTGMGQDGVGGLLKVRAAGGRVIAQDERTSVVFGMPQSAIRAGAASDVLPLGAIAPRLALWQPARPSPTRG